MSKIAGQLHGGDVVESHQLGATEDLDEPFVGLLSPLPKSDPQAPYSDAEVVAMRNWALTQSTMIRRRDAQVLLALGLGAGLSAGDIGLLTTDDVAPDEYGVTLRVSGKRARLVPVRADWEAQILDVVDALGRGRFLFRTDRTEPNRNLVTELIYKCSHIEPAVQSQRLRGTWITGHLADRTPVVPFIEAAGVSSLEALTRYLRFLPDVDPVEARALLRGELKAERERSS